MAAPIPPVEPVTSATLFSRSVVMPTTLEATGHKFKDENQMC
jgi:hypothetical protein